ncbi:MAG: class I SAM-dependent methyltransferase [Candidatus Hodarchaeales archaeon]
MDSLVQKLAKTPGYGNDRESIHSYYSRQLEPSYGTVVLNPFVKQLEENVQTNRVLDLACGAGESADIFESSGFKVNRLDISKKAFAYQGEKDGKVQADMSKLPFLDKSFDGIHAKDALVHVRDKNGLMGEMDRVLIDGGIALVTTAELRIPISVEGRPYFRTKVPDIVDKARSNGFGVIDIGKWEPIYKEIDWYDYQPEMRNLLLLKKK